MSFPLIANEKIRSSVESAISGNRLPHAIIIEGEKGLGKHTLADFLTKASVCEGDLKPCGKCRSCHLAETENHPDISVISPEDKKKNISVGQIRQLKQNAFVKPHKAGKKVFIIDPADTMNEQAQNALLKILEEPPESVIFLLICTSASAMLETVLSRCITLKLSPPDRTSACEYISKIKPKRDKSEIENAVNTSGGNIGRALEILSKKSLVPAEEQAKEFAELIFTASEFELLCRLNKFEKDRPATDTFISAFKCSLANLLKTEYKNPKKAKMITALYTKADDFSASLKTNINLSLLFTDMVSVIARLRQDFLNNYSN